MTTPRPRGRPREFDEETALAAMVDLFWTQGYAATSLDQLAAAAGINRPSLYAAFGNKLSIYLRSLEFFAARVGDAAASALSDGATLEDGLHALYRRALDLYTGGAGPGRGCLVLTVAAADMPAHPEVRRVVAGVLAQVDEVLAHRFARAGVPDPRDRARIATGILISLGQRTRAGDDRGALEALAARAAAMLAAADR